MRKSIYPYLYPVFLLVASCGSPDSEPANPPNLRILSGEEVKLADTNNQFALALFKELNNSHEPNVFFSPLSIGLALGMTLNGAAGETRQGILQAIQFNGLDSAQVNKGYADLTSLLYGMDRKVKLGIANSVWYRNNLTVNGSFKSIIEQSYNGTVQGLDFSNPTSKDNINGWIEEKTNNKIQDMISEISGNQVMFLVNAIYFKGDWTYQFDKSKTKEAPFTKEDGSITPVQMMFSKGVKLSAYANDLVHLVDIPYGNEQFRFTALLPKANLKLNNLLENLSTDSKNSWIFKADTLTPQLEMPRFRMEWNKKINSQLSSMGMGKAFTNQAELPYLFKNPEPLQVDYVQHQSFIEVNEEGAEAAAATVVGIGYTSATPQLPIIKLDRPFIFFIREKHTGTILFAGQLSNPALLN